MSLFLKKEYLKQYILRYFVRINKIIIFVSLMHNIKNGNRPFFMSHRILFFLTIGILLLTSRAPKAQEVQFSQYFANLTLLNPAYAGIKICPLISLNYRNQWPGLNSAYNSYSASYSQYSEMLHGGLGINLTNDRQGGGIVSNLQADGIYAFALQASKNLRLQLGIQTSYVQWSINPQKMTFADQFDPLQGQIYTTAETTPYESIRGFDVSSGLVGSYKKHYFGVAAHHIATPLQSAGQTTSHPMKLTANIGTVFYTKSPDAKRNTLSISPNLIFQQQNGAQTLNYGLYFAKDLNTEVFSEQRSIVAGAWLRQNLRLNFDSFILLFGYIYSNVKIGYSVDFNLNKLIKHSFGAHEISVSFLLPCPDNKKKPGAISCPSF